ncbi:MULTISPECIES: bacterioferritin [Snodgrassella]|uniref:Bacterioferritin n=1 Tax=Snodgrassella alvi TaxID=1196083 RepID=A0A2N9Y465_9NEIS|nr:MULTISPECIES: ferritin-like domain-containing protein [Snodgrassella]KES10792.1 Bacterioferritin (cytochrome b1) [Snodgrassella alvi SCGC AB-598-O11]MBI0067099.1 bacterioferritin [Snodgrassella sp. M0110]MBI0075982.1 bacterioferritin [Snodgrassella sp. M0118]MBI0078400.1 bacterioferritin [Snodgrassella sp. M0112]NUF78925.1 bacterioferritin [Snodgrassella sp. ESL0323]
MNKRKPLKRDIKFSTTEELRENARKNYEDGPVTSTYELDVERVIELLNIALASEWVCVLRYLRHYYMATGLFMDAVKEEFMEHAEQEQKHAAMLAERITQLGGEPDLNPDVFIQRSPTEYIEGETLRDMVESDLIAERIVIDLYRQTIMYVSDYDTTTKRMLEHILAEEEDHADELSDMMEGLDGKPVSKKII